MKVERCGIDAETLAALVARPIGKHVAEVSAAPCAGDLGPHHAVAGVVMEFDMLAIDRLCKARSPRVRIKFRTGRK